MMIGNVSYPFCDTEYILNSFGGIEHYKQISKGVVDEVRRMRGQNVLSDDEKKLFLES